MRRSTQAYQGSGEPCSTWAFGKGGNPYRPLQGRKFYQWTAVRRNIRQEYEQKIEQLPEDQKLSQIVFWCGFEACPTRTILLCSWHRRWTTDATFITSVHDASKRRGDSCERMDSKEYENRCLEHRSLLSWRKIVLKFKYFKTTPFRGSELSMALTDTWRNRC